MTDPIPHNPEESAGDDTDWLARAFPGLLEEGTPSFVERYSGLDDGSWEALLRQAITAPDQDGISFPRFPSAALQQRAHGQAGEPALREAFSFYRVVLAFCAELRFDVARTRRLLDYGAGWGRMLMPFLARIDPKNIFGFEPNPTFCQAGRLHNPYVSFLGGDFDAPLPFNHSTFDIVISSSVFTHLAPELWEQTLGELARVLRRGGLLFLTSWGKRFVETLAAEEVKLQGGADIHWYYRRVIASAGDLSHIASELDAGRPFFIPSEYGPRHGETFMASRAARNFQTRWLSLVAFEQQALSQDLMVFRRL